LLRQFFSKDPGLSALLARKYAHESEIENRVREVLAAVRDRGDRAVFEYTRLFDRVDLHPGNYQVTTAETEAAYRAVSPAFLTALKEAIGKITVFHQHQRPRSWLEPDALGNIVGQVYRSLARVGIYVPGGTAAYPSSVLMNAIPARVAGVPEIIMVTPPGPGATVNPHTLVAAAEAGVTAVYKIGGAQAIATLAFGTEAIPKVDKITGPGNIYVALAKKLVYGQVGIDMVAGPSEILIVADATAPPAYVAADLLSQAEHDVLAAAVLITPVTSLAEQVQQEVERQLTNLPRREIATQALRDYGAIIITADLAEAVFLANRFAPEHLELMVADPFSWLGKVENAGAIFLGKNTPEPVGDYYAGPNHILPTGGTARFASALGVEDFMKKSSVIAYSEAGLQSGSEAIHCLAMVEGLEAHAGTITVRRNKERKDPGAEGKQD
jgi:histidinol dehydrogenase